MTTQQELKELDMPDEAAVFEYLVDLRDSGVTNMWGAAPYIAEQFDVSDKEATQFLMAWIESFD
jgi:hypothetical protein